MAKVKALTKIVGLDVVLNAREVLVGLYSKTLKEFRKVLKDEGYHNAMESFTKHRLSVSNFHETRNGQGSTEHNKPHNPTFAANA
ncbi:hypothetical protein JHK82_048404 [Glycine max]|nr:hypothetical protein JHK86_048264 [Glycine max]KAG5098550.1 hypothetical protein JHK82_048404 [Glycine max]